MSLPTKQQALSNTITAFATAVAVVYALGKRLGEAYYKHHEAVYTDLATFGRAFVTGSSNAINTTYALGVTSRTAFDTYYPVAKPQVLALYVKAKVCHNNVSDYLRSKFANN